MTRGQRWADAVTEFSGSWAFIGWFTALCALWIVVNASGFGRWDPYPFLFLNWLLTVVSAQTTTSAGTAWRFRFSDW